MGFSTLSLSHSHHLVHVSRQAFRSFTRCCTPHPIVVHTFILIATFSAIRLPAFDRLWALVHCDSNSEGVTVAHIPSPFASAHHRSDCHCLFKTG